MFAGGPALLNAWRPARNAVAAVHPIKSRRVKWFAFPSEYILPQLSLDGTRICCQSNRPGPAELWLSDANGGNEVQLTRGGLRPAIGRWSPDGKTIVFNQAATSTMYVVAAAGGRPRLVTGSSLPGALLTTFPASRTVPPRRVPRSGSGSFCCEKFGVAAAAVRYSAPNSAICAEATSSAGQGRTRGRVLGRADCPSASGGSGRTPGCWSGRCRRRPCQPCHPGR